ncbi:ribonuclease H-like domain-containing protein [Globomyces pollinis-pini]|nr:ribonuclease H-like domain-containing protein [Globomyces pollinis-pini]KAJ2994629.1 3'-5' exonuclease [Globomyces sp. JEL0801]
MGKIVHSTKGTSQGKNQVSQGKNQVSSNWKLLSKTLTKPKLSKVTKKVSQKASTINTNAVEKEIEVDPLSKTTERDLSILDSILNNSNQNNAFSDLDDDDQPELPVYKTDNEKTNKKTKKEIHNSLHHQNIQNNTTPSLLKPKIGKYIAMDCEMVGVGDKGSTSVLARVSLVNFHGETILDEFVLPQERITDFRTKVSGITPQLLKEQGKPFKEVQQQVADLVKDKIIIGHGLKNDFDALLLDHPRKLTRDTTRYKPLKNPNTKRPKSLKNLAKEHLNITIQTGEHSSVEDAKANMLIYRKFKDDWEKTLFRYEKVLRPHSW